MKIKQLILTLLTIRFIKYFIKITEIFPQNQVSYEVNRVVKVGNVHIDKISGCNEIPQ